MITVKSNSLARAIHVILCGGICVMGAAASTVWAAESSVDIGTVQATAQTTGATGSAAQVASAPYQAPSKTPLNVTQPTSVISRHYISHNVAPTSNYDEIIKNTPSVSSDAPNGPGMMENMGLSIRGFQDGQYNITFDGIPWADSNDFTHHTTSYLMAHDIGQVAVDRGPGTAATVGYATFGGTISIQTENPTKQTSVEPYMTLGSFGTQLYGIEFNTGSLKKYNGAKALLDFEHAKSNGFLSYSGQTRSNLFFKAIAPIGNNTQITFAAMYNKLHQYVPTGATQADIAKFGYNYGLSNNPKLQSYYGYNYDQIQTDFEYIDLQSYLGHGWSLDNKLYTDSYTHFGFNGGDTTVTDTTSNGTSYSPTDVPGQKMTMQYRSIGDFARLAKQTRYGVLNTGLWFENQVNHRWEYNIDWTLGGALDPIICAGPVGTTCPPTALVSPDRLMTETLTTFQPYVEFAWKVTPKLTVTPGVKLAYFRRSLNAAINDGKNGQHPPAVYAKSWSSLLPSIDLHYHIQHGWVAYAQAAKGFLAPRLQLWKGSTAEIQQAGITPQESTNFQLGTTWKSRRLALAADVYHIKENHDFQKFQTTPSNYYYVDYGSAVYQGLELEGTYYVGGGLSVYANGSLNSAKAQDGSWIANAPNKTAALGLIYNRKGWYGSIMDKYNGQEHTGAGGSYEIMPGYSLADASIGYTLKQGSGSAIQKVKINLQVKNLFDKKGFSQYLGGTGTGAEYWVIPGRSAFVSLSATF